MLPTTGYFKNIDCPYYENTCDRPYCHFKHRKKPQESSQSSTATPEIPTYNPTPKSQLAVSRSHIPISYVPDLAIGINRNNFHSLSSGFRDKQPTYNPTPLSILSTNKNKLTDDNNKSDETITLNITPYSPTSFQDAEINFEDLKSEFDMIDELMSTSNTTEANKDVKDSKTSNKMKTHSKSSSSSSNSKSKCNGDINKDKSKSHSSSKKTSLEHKSNKREHKDKHSSSSRNRKKSSSKEKDRHKSKTKERDKEKKSSNNKEKKRKTKDVVKSDAKKIKSEENITSSMYALTSDYMDSDIEDDPFEECFKIFNEYKPTEPQILSESTKPDISQEQEVSVYSKKRIAHENVDKNKPKTFNKLKPPNLSPAQVMVNRLKMIREAQVNREQTDDIVEIQKQINKKEVVVDAPPKVTKISKPKLNVPPPSTSIVDDIISGRTSSTSKPKRIAPVQNVNSIQKAKERIVEMAKIRAANIIANKTTTQTISKGVKRTAHAPEINVDIPDLLEVVRSKLPVNVRSRYLTMIVEECVKLYYSREEAHQRAVNEEHKCYERCAVLTTYRNSAMLAINRLRKELQEREAAGLGLILPGNAPSSDKNKESDLTGRKFYKNIKKFVLNEEELVLHGFPREGSIPGQAVVRVQRSAPKIHLDEYDRICSRCSKIYHVDKDGFALYEEECLYHPLKKRTFRGESIYLCCKTGEGAGCVTSPTHVSEKVISNETELEGYQTTMPSENNCDLRSVEVFALDCEMCYTTKGLELTRVTIVNSECKTVYETLVKPLNPIIDYNTRFSGITEEQMNRTATSILQVQANILHLCNSDTILIGHSLESDMKALKIIHSSIVDTSVLFPHKFGLPHKRALRDLAREYLSKIIQNDVSGHDSAEDALTCMELIQWKVKEEYKTRGIKV